LAGSGFSYADEGDIGVVNESEMADNMYEFLQTFFATNPKYSKLPFFVFGESYGGHYVPALSARIYAGNMGMRSARGYCLFYHTASEFVHRLQYVILRS